MSKQIRTWQIVNEALERIDTSLQSSGKTEVYDLEPWLESNPEIVSEDLLLIGRQVKTKSGFMDLLGIDSSGNTVIIELKRDSLPREALAQGIDYASDVAQWSYEQLNDVCHKYMDKNLDEAFAEKFPDIDAEAINVNATQKILLVGFSVESSLERMIEWLSQDYNVSINAIILSYVQTKSGDELLTKTSVLSEEIVEQRTKSKSFTISKCDKPGTFNDEDLKKHLIRYLSIDKVTNQKIRKILLPALLPVEVLTRDQVVEEFEKAGFNRTRAGKIVAWISNQMSMKKNSFLRQVVSYGNPIHDWEKNDYAARPEYKELVKEVLQELEKME